MDDKNPSGFLEIAAISKVYFSKKIAKTIVALLSI